MILDEELARNRVQKGHCDGGCEQHVGKVKLVKVYGWGYFAYCDAAIEENQRRCLPQEIESEAGNESSL